MKPRDNKKQADQLLADYLHVLRNQFYPDDTDRFYKHRYMLVQAISWPSKIMVHLGVWLPFDRQRQILDEIIRGIKRHGDTDSIKHFGGYFLDCVQKHMRFHQDNYYEEAKTATAKAIASLPLGDILKGAQVATTEPTDAQESERLVQIAATFRPKRRPKKEPDTQGSLW